MDTAKQARVDIWTLALDESWSPVLLPAEQIRAARFRFDHDRARWTNARTALRTILASYRETKPFSLHFLEGNFGKPWLAGGPHFNLSHSGEWGMIAVTEAAPVGIDIEKVRGDVDIARLLRRIGETAVADTETDLFRIWSRREARTKAIGGPLMELPSGDLRVVDLTAPAGFTAALALVAHDPLVRYRNFPSL